MEFLFFQRISHNGSQKNANSKTPPLHKGGSAQQENTPVVAADPVDANVVNLNNNINII